jgi:hypothetical protein
VSTWESVVVDTPISRAACVCVTSPAAISPRSASRGSTFSATSVIIASVHPHVEQGPVAAGPLFAMDKAAIEKLFGHLPRRA